MLQSIQVIGNLAILSALLNVLGSQKCRNSQSSFTVQEKNITSEINLSSLEGDTIVNVVKTSTRVVSQSTSSGENSPSKINIHRYYVINPFTHITTSKFSNTNCPENSMSCLVSDVTFECTDDQDGNGVCINNPQLTADSYGYQSRCHVTVHPSQSLSSNEDVKGATVVITMKGGRCYYCDNPKCKLSTLIGFYCDERVTGQGTPRRIEDPTKTKPQATLHWNTSAACYEFIPHETCPTLDFTKICNYMSFSCGKHHQYTLPHSANTSMKHSTSTATYTFGFCARDVKCPTTDKSVMICKSWEGQNYQVLAYYNDSIELIPRPTGFVMRIRQRPPDSSLKAVISFECSSATSSLTNLDVLEDDTLPILLTLKHQCFCPDTTPCQEQAPKAPENLKKPIEPNGTSWAIIVAYIVGSLIVITLVYLIQKSSCRTNQRAGNGNNVPDEGASQANQGTEEISIEDTLPSSYQSSTSGRSRDTSPVDDSDEKTPLLDQKI